MAGTGFRVVSATSPVDAEGTVEAGDIAVTLTAVGFPRGNGYDFARQVRARNPQAVVFLLCGGFEVYNAERAEQCGIAGRIYRPFTVETLRRHLEVALGPLVPAEVEPEVEPEPLDPPFLPVLEELADGPVSITPDDLQLEAPARPAVADERMASFLPRDWRTFPPVRVDPDVVGPAIERAILELLPEVVEVVLAKALVSSPGFRDLVEAAVDEAVRAQVGPIARRVILERISEIEAGGDEPG